ncbi:hypothetical protein BDZ94DRAFT_289104 [Collybia nuda]|uniref:Uncharacterized protein n=1 Tax=Collybia nuda TaxID=64659 RepID=A0A9P5XUG3_9AGAR|nr:hypothetical protein BDZ94DRAFT_289104 [Collybia nuda]
MHDVSMALGMVKESRRLPVVLETFHEDIRKNYHLIHHDVKQFMENYEIPMLLLSSSFAFNNGSGLGRHPLSLAQLSSRPSR